MTQDLEHLHVALPVTKSSNLRGCTGGGRKKKRRKKKAANAYAEGLKLKENKRKPSSAPELGTVPVSKAHRMHISIDQSGPAAASVPPLTVAVPSWIQDPSCAPASL